MSSQAVKTLGLFQKLTPLDRGFAARLPAPYKKFYKEWKLTESTAINYIPEEGKWKRDEITGEVHPIQNIPIPVKYPKEFDQQLWGGEGVVQGCIKKHKYNRRVPRFWIPSLKRSAVYSEVLNKHISVVVTDRAIQLIHDNYGFDHYLLKTLACDLKSLLPLGLKRRILQDLEKGCPAYEGSPEKQKAVYERYKNYLSAYTSEEIEWYGYSVAEACTKFQAILDEQNIPVPLKHVYRSQLLEKLKAANISEAAGIDIANESSWIQKMNPFAKKRET